MFAGTGSRLNWRSDIRSLRRSPWLWRQLKPTGLSDHSNAPNAPWPSMVELMHQLGHGLSTSSADRGARGSSINARPRARVRLTVLDIADAKVFNTNRLSRPRIITGS
jgi:hypothetical protein